MDRSWVRQEDCFSSGVARYDGGPFEYNNVQLSPPSATVLFAHYLVASAWPLRAVFIPAATARPTKTQDTRRGELFKLMRSLLKLDFGILFGS